MSRFYKYLETPDTLVFDRVTFSPTTYCSLKCRDCSAFISMVKKPRHIDLNILKSTIDVISESADFVFEADFCVGEPLMYPYLDEAIYYTSTKKNIHNRKILTNETIIPSKKLIEALVDTNSELHLSNYGLLSTKINEIKDLSIKYNFRLFIEDFSGMTKWIRPRITENKRPIEDVLPTVEWCKVNKMNGCVYVFDNRFYLCGGLAFKTEIGLITDSEENYVNLLDGEPNKKKEILDLTNSRPLPGCHYCTFDDTLKRTDFVEPAIQVR